MRVITSYSIHYTKLYESRTGGNRDVTDPSRSDSGVRKEPVDGGKIACGRLQAGRKPDLVPNRAVRDQRDAPAGRRRFSYNFV